MTEATPALFIVDSALDVTGGFMAASRQAALTGDLLRATLVLPNDHRLPASAQTAFAETIRLPIVSLRKSIGAVVGYLPSVIISGVRLRIAMHRGSCNLLQLNDFHLMHGAIVRLLGYRGRIVTWVRIDPKRYGVIGRIWLALARWSSDELVSVSKFIARQLPDGYRSTLIYDSMPPVGDASDGSGDQLLFIGNYIEGKGQDDAIRAFHRIAAKFPEAELHFHGGDMGLAKNLAYREHLTTLADDGDGKGRIYISDFVKDPHPLYWQALAAINFSHSESFSLTCLEASAHGLPVIATRCGGPEEIVADDVSGYLVAIGDVDAMAARMAGLLGDPVRAAMMGKAGRRLVSERFGTAQFQRQIAEIFDLR